MALGLSPGWPSALEGPGRLVAASAQRVRSFHPEQAGLADVDGAAVDGSAYDGEAAADLDLRPVAAGLGLESKAVTSMRETGAGNGDPFGQGAPVAVVGLLGGDGDHLGDQAGDPVRLLGLILHHRLETGADHRAG